MTATGIADPGMLERMIQELLAGSPTLAGSPLTRS
jgi:hypothetical protein